MFVLVKFPLTDVSDGTMELSRVTRTEKARKKTPLEQEVPSAPTMEDFFVDPCSHEDRSKQVIAEINDGCDYSSVAGPRDTGGTKLRDTGGPVAMDTGGPVDMDTGGPVAMDTGGCEPSDTAGCDTVHDPPAVLCDESSVRLSDTCSNGAILDNLDTSAISTQRHESSAPIESSAPPIESSAPPIESSAPPIESSAPLLESSAPLLESSAPPLESSAPPLENYTALSSRLQEMSPHQTLQPQLSAMRKEQEEQEEEEEEEYEEYSECQEEMIVPFTESQLHALYHNVELEKNVEFVEHWLETQVVTCNVLYSRPRHYAPTSSSDNAYGVIAFGWAL